MKRKLSSLQKAKSQTLGFFTFIVYQNTHQTSSSKFRIPSKTDCRKTGLTRRYSTQQKVSTKTLWRRASSKLILNRPKINNKNQNIDLEISFGLTRHSTKQYPRMLQKLFFDWSIDIFQSHRLHKIFNRNTVKVSYSCTQNKSKIYKWHNGKITSTPCNQLTSCNWREKGECSMEGKCQTMDAVYDCRVTSSEPRITKWYSHETTLSSYV